MVNDLILAAAYADMADSMAFRDFMRWLEDWVAEAEREAKDLKPEHKIHFEAYFMRWQQRKDAVDEIKHHVQIAREVHKENTSERPSIDGDPGNLNNPEYTFRGY